jgi:Holliday junction resolvase RusA-like endonuclease
VRYVNKRINGIPYPRQTGNKEAGEEWTNQVIAQTDAWPRIGDACALRVTFLLPPNKFPDDLPYGPDLDNVLKRLLDGLGKTVFREAQGTDSCVIILEAMKTKVSSEDEAGVHIEVLPIKPSLEPASTVDVNP